MEVLSNETESRRGSPISKLDDLCWKGPTWLSNISLWPRQPTIDQTTESQVECKSIKDVMTTAIEKSDTFLRITAWIKRFLNNCQKTKRSRPLKTEKAEHQRKILIKREQQGVKYTEKFEISKEMLDLQENVEGIYAQQALNVYKTLFLGHFYVTSYMYVYTVLLQR